MSFDSTISDGKRSGSLCVAIVGAESTGKTTLAQELAAHLQHQFEPRGLQVAWVPEVLREWCSANGRTPQAHEQAALLREQHQRINAAAQSHEVVVCDTTALMTAVYSRIVFGDRSLDERAATLHLRQIDLTLLTALDLPWVADGLQRDGPQVQEPVDRALRELMRQHGIQFQVVGGSGPRRLMQALDALQATLRSRTEAAGAAGLPKPRVRSLFADLDSRSKTAARWSCDCCGATASPHSRAPGRARA